MKTMFVMLIFHFTTLSLAADEYEFDVSEFAKKPLTFANIVEFRSTFIFPEEKSYAAKLKYYNQIETPTVLDNYLLSLTPSLSFDNKGFQLKFTGDVWGRYNHPESDWEFDATLFEGYLKYEFNPQWHILLGKKSYKWGKGYVFNPSSFASRQKDVNNVDAALEGFYSASVQYVKSFTESVMQMIAQEIVFLPMYKKINESSNVNSQHWAFLHTYFLLFNTDYDLFIALSQDFDYKLGLGIAHNIRTNWEVHAELAYLPKETKKMLNRDASVFTKELNNTMQTVVGTRYLTPFNTTFYLEYIYNGIGLTKTEANQWYTNTRNILTLANAKKIKGLKKQWFSSMNKQYLMNHYFYLKMQHPEPFHFLYFTPSLYVLLSVSDQSFLMGLDMNYKRFEAVNFNIKVVGLYGKSNTEFGTKMSELKTEFSLKWYF